MPHCDLLPPNDHRSVLRFCVSSAEVPEGRAAELMCRLQSQRLFTAALVQWQLLYWVPVQKESKRRPAINVEEE